MRSIRCVLACLVLAGQMGCAGEPVPVPAPEPATVDSRADAVKVPQAPETLPLKPAAKAFSPFSKPPPMPDRDQLPGTGAKFPLRVTVVSKSTGLPVRGWLAGEWYPFTSHPNTHRPGDGATEIHHETDAEVSFEWFTPAIWEFVLTGPGAPKFRFNTGIWTSPPGGSLTIPIDDFTLSGQVVGPDGKGFGGSHIKLKGQGLAIDPEVARYVRYITSFREVISAEDGTFTVPHMMPGNWIVMFDTARIAQGGTWQPWGVNQVVEVVKGQALTLKAPAEVEQR